MGPLLVQVVLVTSLAAVPMTGEVTSLAGSMKCVEDPSGVLTFAEVGSVAFESKLIPSEKAIPNFGFTDSVYWCRSQVENRTKVSEWVLEIGYPLLDYVDVFIRYADGGIIHERGGDMLPFAERYRPHRTINFSAQIGLNQTVEVWIRVKTESSVQLPLVLKSEGVFGDIAIKEMVSFGIYYGIMLVMIVFNALLFFSLRDSSYFHYVGFLASYLLFSLQLHGTGFQYLFPDYPLVANKALVFSCFVSQAFLCSFTVDFISKGSRTPRLMKYFWYLGRFLWLFSIGSATFISYGISIRFGAVVMLASVLLFIYAGFAAWKGGYRPAGLYLLAWAAVFVGAFLLVLKALGVLPSMFLTDYGMQIGSALLAMLLSLALADRIRITQLERDVANQAMLHGYKALEHELNRRQDIQIENDQLLLEMQKAKEQLTQADKLSSLGQLTAGVAHDIASPTGYIANARDEVAEELGVIRQTLDELVGDDPSAEAQELRDFFGQKFTHIDSLLGNMATGTDRIKAIHQAIRNYTRVDAEPETGQGLGPIVGEAVTILSSKLKAFHVVVELDGLPGVTCKRSQLGQVFANLLSNAADALQDYKDNHASEAFTGRIEVRGMSVRHGGFEGVAVRVEDNGPGIPADIRERIGEAFFTTKAVGKGTGLGMSICQRIVDAHGGKLGIGDSVELGGASMTVWLPLKPIEERVD